MARKSSLASPAASGPFPDFQGEDDHRTLQRAEEIKADSHRMVGVRKHHRKTMRAMSNLGKAMGGKR